MTMKPSTTQVDSKKRYAYGAHTCSHPRVTARRRRCVQRKPMRLSKAKNWCNVLNSAYATTKSMEDSVQNEASAGVRCPLAMLRVARAVESTTEGRTKPAIAKQGRCIMPMETVFTSVWLDMLYQKAQSA
eukprot:1459333-Rhodomonas_salina.1